jgi:hypothetical protein
MDTSLSGIPIHDLGKADPPELNSLTSKHPSLDRGMLATIARGEFQAMDLWRLRTIAAQDALGTTSTISLDPNHGLI